MSTTIRCPHCKGHLLQKSGSLRLKGRMTLQKSGLSGNCYWCGGSVTVPMKLEKAQPEQVLVIPREPSS